MLLVISARKTHRTFIAQQLIKLTATIDGKDFIISKLKAEIEVSNNAELYFALKYAKWKDIGIFNKLGNFHLSQNYLTLEFLCTELRKKLVIYQERLSGSKAYSLRASTSIAREVFPAIPLRPAVVPSFYFAKDELQDPEVKQLTTKIYKELTFCAPDNFKGKGIVKLSPHKNRSSAFCLPNKKTRLAIFMAD